MGLVEKNNFFRGSESPNKNWKCWYWLEFNKITLYIYVNTHTPFQHYDNFGGVRTVRINKKKTVRDLEEQIGLGPLIFFKENPTIIGLKKHISIDKNDLIETNWQDGYNVYVYKFY